MWRQGAEIDTVQHVGTATLLAVRVGPLFFILASDRSENFFASGL